MSRLSYKEYAEKIKMPNVEIKRRILFYKKYYELGRDRMLISTFVSDKKEFFSLENYMEYCIHSHLNYRFFDSTDIQMHYANKIIRPNSYIYIILCKTKRSHPYYNKINYRLIGDKDLKSRSTDNCIDDYIHIAINIGEILIAPKAIIYNPYNFKTKIDENCKYDTMLYTNE